METKYQVRFTTSTRISHVYRPRSFPHALLDVWTGRLRGHDGTWSTPAWIPICGPTPSGSSTSLGRMRSARPMVNASASWAEHTCRRSPSWRSWSRGHTWFAPHRPADQRRQRQCLPWTGPFSGQVRNSTDSTTSPQPHTTSRQTTTRSVNQPTEPGIDTTKGQLNPDKHNGGSSEDIGARTATGPLSNARTSLMRIYLQILVVQEQPHVPKFLAVPTGSTNVSRSRPRQDTFPSGHTLGQAAAPGTSTP